MATRLLHLSRSSYDLSRRIYPLRVTEYAYREFKASDLPRAALVAYGGGRGGGASSFGDYPPERRESRGMDN
jgi:hypothetical protein